MASTQPVDTELLEEWIEKSGYRIGFIADTLGISCQAFDKKRKGVIPFRKSEMYVLTDMLKLPNEVATRIFYPES